MTIEEIMELYDSNLNMTLFELSQISGVSRDSLQKLLLAEPSEVLKMKRKLEKRVN